MSVLAMLNKTCSVYPFTWTVDPITRERVQYAGAPIVTKCKVDVLTDQELGRPAQAGQTDYDVFFPYSETLRDALKPSSYIQDITGMDDMKLDVMGDPQDDCGRLAYLRVRARHVTGGSSR